MSPPLVIEYVSGDGSEERDRTPSHGKFWVYEKAIKAPHYLIWSPNEERIEAFELKGTRYAPMAANTLGRFHVPPLGVDFGIWDGEYLGYPGPWLRAWSEDGRLLLSGDEGQSEERGRAEAEKTRANTELKRANAEKLRAEAEKRRADALAAKLRELGVDPDGV